MERFILIFLIIGWLATRGMKTQLIRILDVLIYGPFLIWLGYSEREKWIKVFLYFIGATTMTYNLRNFIELQYP
jgi:hypothetical protein